MNLGGAKDRPNLDQVWENVQAKLLGATVKHSEYSKMALSAGLSQKIWGRPVVV